MPSPKDALPPLRPRIARRPRIVVVGSINLDLVVTAARLPRPGETVLGDDVARIPGGKGANQAVAAARLGAETIFIGRVGDDESARMLVDSLVSAGVDVSRLRTAAGICSGTAVIAVAADGQNTITVVPGANHRLTAADVEEESDAFRGADAVLVQLEIPSAAAVAALRAARAAGALAILDSAPVPPLAERLPELWQADVVSPNQSEAEALVGVAAVDLPTAQRAAEALAALGAVQVALKMGAAGAFWRAADGATRFTPSFPVEAVDATAAGDAFTAALAVALAEGKNADDGMRFACAAGGLAASKRGAQPAMPTREAVEALLAAHPPG